MKKVSKTAYLKDAKIYTFHMSLYKAINFQRDQSHIQLTEWQSHQPPTVSIIIKVH